MNLVAKVGDEFFARPHLSGWPFFEVAVVLFQKHRSPERVLGLVREALQHLGGNLSAPSAARSSGKSHTRPVQSNSCVRMENKDAIAEVLF